MKKFSAPAVFVLAALAAFRVSAADTVPENAGGAESAPAEAAAPANAAEPEPAAEPAVEPAHVAEPTPAPAHVAEPTPAPAHVAEPATAPAHSAEPVAEPAHVAKPVAEPAHVAKPEHAAKPVAEPAHPSPAPVHATAPAEKTVHSYTIPVAPSASRPHMRTSYPTAYRLPERESFYDVWLDDRLAIGLSFTWLVLVDENRPPDVNRKKTFIGYVNHEDVEHEFSVAPVVSWLASDYVRLSLAYAQAEASTLNFNNHLGDGTIRFQGVVFSVEGMYPLLEGELRPHAGVGVGLYHGEFEEDDWWRLGFSSPEAWAAAGHTRKTPGGHYRSISLENAVSPSLSAGVAWRPVDHFELDLSVRYSILTADASFDYVYAKKTVHQLDGEFDLDNVTFALTASYVF